MEWFLCWRRRGSNSRPYGCEPYALPTGSLICTTIPVEASMYLSLKIDHCRVIVGKMYMASVNFQDAAIQILFYKLYPIHSWDVNATAAIWFASSLRAVENWRFRTICSHPRIFLKYSICLNYRTYRPYIETSFLRPEYTTIWISVFIKCLLNRRALTIYSNSSRSLFLLLRPFVPMMGI